MKFQGKQFKRYTGYATFVRGESRDDLHEVRIRIQALPITWQDECERVLPEPMPPVVGKVFDKHGNAQPKYDHEDQTYQAQHTQWQYRTWAKKIYDATIDPNVEWETSADVLAAEGAEAFYDRIFDELLEGFTRGEISQWLLSVNTIDQVGGADVALAEERLIQGVRRFIALRDVEAGEGEPVER